MPWIAGGTVLAAYLASQQGGGGGSSSPLPTYYQEMPQTAQQQAMWGMMEPSLQQMYGGQIPTPTQAQIGGAPSFDPVTPGQMPQWGGVQAPSGPQWGGVSTPTTPQWGGVQTPQAPGPTAGWYGGLDPNVRAGIEEPYMRSMEMMREGLSGRGQLGAMGSGETPAFSGAAADVFGRYAHQAAPAMAQTAWGMMQPGLLAQQQQQYGANVMGAQRPWEAGMTQQGQQFQANILGAERPWEAGMTQQGQQFQANVMGAERPWEAGMTQMGQQYGGGMQAQQLAATTGLQQTAAQNQAALMAQQQGWEGQMTPYQALPSLLPQTYPDWLVGHTPTIQQTQPGAPIPPGFYQTQPQQPQGWGTPQDPTGGMYGSNWYNAR